MNNTVAPVTSKPDTTLSFNLVSYKQITQKQDHLTAHLNTYLPRSHPSPGNSRPLVCQPHRKDSGARRAENWKRLCMYNQSRSEIIQTRYRHCKRTNTRCMYIYMPFPHQISQSTSFKFSMTICCTANICVAI